MFLAPIILYGYSNKKIFVESIQVQLELGMWAESTEKQAFFLYFV